MYSKLSTLAFQAMQRKLVEGTGMLTHWIFVMFISGQPVMTEQRASEAACNRMLVRLVAAARAQGKDAIGAFYLRAT
jgi:hypothetical protein